MVRSGWRPLGEEGQRIIGFRHRLDITSHPSLLRLETAFPMAQPACHNGFDVSVGLIQDYPAQNIVPKFLNLGKAQPL